VVAATTDEAAAVVCYSPSPPIISRSETTCQNRAGAAHSPCRPEPTQAIVAREFFYLFITILQKYMVRHKFLQKYTLPP
jgi:hypothetical protein